MKIERKSKTTRRDKKQRKSHLSKRAKKSPNFKYQQINETQEVEIKPTKKTSFIENETDNHDSKNVNFDFLEKIRLKNILSPKLVLIATMTIAIVVVSFNIKPILENTFQDEKSALYPILKKYADDLRDISSRLTVVTRRLNMLSLISEENEINNIMRINSLVLQVNEMWFTTKKYLNFIGIETIAHTDLEKEIDANSKINEKGLIRETKAEEIIPENELTLTNVLKLDSVVQELNSQIKNVNNEITFLEDNVFASIRASHIYSHLLERSRNANGNYYANSSAKYDNTKVKIATTNQTIPTNTNLAISNNTPIQVKTKTIQTIPVKKPVKEAKIAITVPIKQPVKVAKVVIPVKQAEIVTTQTQKEIATEPKKPKAILSVKIPRNKIVGEFKIKEKPANKSRKDQQNKLASKKAEPSTLVKVDPDEIPKSEDVIEPYQSKFLLDDVIMDFVTDYDDYDEESSEEEVTEFSGIEIEEDDYTGG